MMVLSGHLAEVPMENHKKCRTFGVLARQIPNVSRSQLKCSYIHTSDDIIWITNHYQNVYSPCLHGFGLKCLCLPQSPLSAYPSSTSTSLLCRLYVTSVLSLTSLHPLYLHTLYNPSHMS